MSSVFIVLYDVECVACGVVDRLWQDVVSGLVECRACGDRVLVGADGETVAGSADLEGWGATDFGDGDRDGGDAYGYGSTYGSWDRPYAEYGDWYGGRHEGGAVWGAR